MKVKVYSIYDSAAGAYTQPWFMQNDALALRAFSDNVNAKEENNISKHPDQFTLFQIGEWDDQIGEIIKADVMKSLGNGLEYQEQDQQKDSVMTELQFIRKLLEEK
jgi:hypothetical protein